MENDINFYSMHNETFLDDNLSRPIGWEIPEGDEKAEQNGGQVSPYVQALMYIMYITISVAAIGGNGIVCFIVLAYQKMRTVTNFFIVNLAVGDIMMASLCIPFTFVSNIILMYWPFGAIMCPIVSYAQAISVFISAYTMVAISIDRYIAIIYPLRPRMTKLHAKVTILLVWVVAIVTPLPTVIYSRLARPANWTYEDKFVCTEVFEEQEQLYYYSMALTVLQYVLPLFALIFTYARIALVVWGKRVPGEAEDSRDQRLAASKRKMVKMMITVVIIFTLCWLPLNILMAIGTRDTRIWSIPGMVYVWAICHWLAMSHACYNPIIYCWMNARFRDGFRHVFRHVPGIRGMLSKRRLEEDNSLKRCNTYTTSYTSVRTTSIRSAGHRMTKSNMNSQIPCSDKTLYNESMIMLKKNQQLHPPHVGGGDDDDDETGETHI